MKTKEELVLLADIVAQAIWLHAYQHNNKDKELDERASMIKYYHKLCEEIKEWKA